MIAPRRKSLVHVVGLAERGGCERCAELFIRHTPECSHRVLVLGSAGPMSPIWASLGAAVVHLDVLSRNWLAFRQDLATGLAASDFDGAIVWAGIRIPWVLSAFARTDRPVVLHAGNPYGGNLRTHLGLQLGSLLDRPAQVSVVGCSVQVADSFRRAPLYRRLPIAACLNPVVAPQENPHCTRSLTPADRIRIGMVARLDPIKDHLTLLRAFGELKRIWPKAELHLAGDGVMRPVLEADAHDLGVAPAVTFHGSIGDVSSFLRGLDLFAYFTTKQEGMGVALVEAMAQGLPCVVSDLPVMREVGGGGAECGVQVVEMKPVVAAQAMDVLLRDATARTTLSAKAHARACGPFAPRTVVERYLSLLEAPC